MDIDCQLLNIHSITELPWCELTPPEKESNIPGQAPQPLEGKTGQTGDGETNPTVTPYSAAQGP